MNTVIVFEKMDPPKEPFVEEPYPGWLRIEKDGQRPFYKTPFPRTVLRSAAMLKDFLGKEKAAGRMKEVDEKQFSFKRRHGVKVKDAASPELLDQVQGDAASPTEVGVAPDGQVLSHGEPTELLKHRTVVELLTREPDKSTNHRKLLSNTAKLVDKFRPKIENQTDFEVFKEKLMDASDMSDIVTCLTQDEQGIEALRSSFSDLCLAEISQINVKDGPLVEFPPSVNENVYCQVAEYGMQSCPQLISLAINLVVRKEDPVLPSDVLKIATLFSNMCYSANHDIDALVKLRSIILQVDGLSNMGLDVLSDCGLTQCSRSLSNHRDLFAEVGRAVMDNTAASLPIQSILDNCDLQQEHLTLEVVQRETIDTSNLSVDKKSKEEALALFCKEEVLLGAEQNKEERDHLLYVVGVAAGKILASNRPEAKKLASYLPAHHLHQNSHLKPTPAITFILKPYPYTETKNPDMIKLMIRIQRQFLHAVAKAQECEQDFLVKLKLLEDPDAENEVRENAEKEVKEVVLKFGVWIGAGDLLTVKMIQEAVMLMAGSATAFGRLEFLGPFRLQLLHMKMKKISQDYAVCMKREINFDDKLSLPWLTALTRVKVSNKAKGEISK